MIGNIAWFFFTTWIAMVFLGATYHWGWGTEPLSFWYTAVIILAVTGVGHILSCTDSD